MYKISESKKTHQVGFHIQGIYSGVFGADLNIDNIFFMYLFYLFYNLQFIFTINRGKILFKKSTICQLKVKR